MRWEQHVEFKQVRLDQTIVVEHAPVRFEFQCSRNGNDLVIRYSAGGEASVSSKKYWWYNSHFVFEFDFAHDHQHRQPRLRRVRWVSRANPLIRQRKRWKRS